MEENEEQNIDTKTILNYPSAVHNLYNTPEDIVLDSDALADNDVKSMSVTL